MMLVTSIRPQHSRCFKPVMKNVTDLGPLAALTKL